MEKEMTHSSLPRKIPSTPIRPEPDGDHPRFNIGDAVDAHYDDRSIRAHNHVIGIVGRGYKGEWVYVIAMSDDTIVYVGESNISEG